MSEPEVGSTAAEADGEPVSPRTARPRRQVSILPWAAADGPAEPPPGRPNRPRRAPVPPSGLVADPGPGGVEDPLAALPPWLPPVRRQPPNPHRPRGQAPRTGARPALPPGPSQPPARPPAPRHRPGPPPDLHTRPPAPPRIPHQKGPRTDPPLPDRRYRGSIDRTDAPSIPTPPTAAHHPSLPWSPPRPEPAPDAAWTALVPGPPPSKPPVEAPEPPPNPEPGLPPFGTAPPPRRPSPADLATPRKPAAAPVPAVTPKPPPPRVAPVTESALTADAISHEYVVRARADIPQVGWRAALYAATGGRVNLGLGGAERAHLRLMERVRAPLDGARHIAVTSIKGGVGKTTVAACLGLTLADYRGEGVVAVDADPDAGTLADRLSGAATVTVRDLLSDLDKIKALGQFGDYTTLAGRLRVLAGDQDPAMGEAFRREEYQRVCRALARFFDIVITDSGTGLVHSAMKGTLELADTLIVVGTPTVDGASRASKTLDWLLAHGYERLAEEAILVLCRDRSSRKVNNKQIRRHFHARCKHVLEIPADPHLYSGGVINPERLMPATTAAFLHLAAVVADGFVAPAPRLALPAGR
ncbi:MinD/ParA family ATP-binding protein [Pseudonocardia acaciae]|uniref:MinD/ParA family ATP-binding protein n=1 Tax=Pseudonocardia acaciae TaxID=551276 RepID=UPI000688FEA4|nr:MinD/ParA family protein [Pseudonocardia acaciae]